MPRPPKSGRALLSVRLDKETIPFLKAVALKCGYSYDGEGSIGQLLDAMKDKEILLFKRVDVPE